MSPWTDSKILCQTNLWNILIYYDPLLKVFFLQYFKKVQSDLFGDSFEGGNIYPNNYRIVGFQGIIGDSLEGCNINPNNYRTVGFQGIIALLDFKYFKKYCILNVETDLLLFP